MGLCGLAGRLATGAALLLLAAASAAKDIPRSEWTSLAPGLWYRAWSIARSTDAVSVTGHAFRADPKAVRVTMLAATGEDRGVARVDALRRESGALLVVNASFFDPEKRPLGLVVGDGKEKNRLRKVDQGVFLIANDEPRIQHTRDPLPENVQMAVQAFPRLIVDGRPLRLKPQSSRRTAVCVPGDGTTVIVIVPSSISLADLASALARPPAEGGLGCWAALNLDGGPSTQLSVATPEMSLEIEGGWPIPNGLAIFPR